MEIYYDPLDQACKSVTGAFARECEVTFRIYCKQGGEGPFSAAVCDMVLHRDGEPCERFPMTRTDDGWEVALVFHETGLWFYHFAVGEAYLVPGRMGKGVLAGAPADWQITVFSEDFETPDWFKGGVMYQIFPDRFCKVGESPLRPYQIARRWGELPNYTPTDYGQVLNNDFFGGNLKGILSKLDYLASLGVTVLYLNPIFEAYSNHRYDTGDYMKIDPALGTAEEFDELVSEAGKRGMRIILDGVFNHTGSDSRYFNQFGRYPSLGAYQSKDSPYADWYRFHPFPDDYDCWWGIRTLPAVNEASESYQRFLFGENGVIKTWLRHGIGGFRLDVADELPDFFVKLLRKAVKEEAPEALVLGEVWEDASNKIAYDVRREYFRGAELDSVMNYPLKDAIINFVLSASTQQLRETLAMLIDHYPKAVLDCLMNVLGTHDTVRILTVLGRKLCMTKEEMANTALSAEERSRAIELLHFAAFLQYTLPGVPCIYYGDENGMEGYADPFCRRCFDWERLDEALIAFYCKLGGLRSGKLAAAFRDGRYREVFADNSCLVFERRSGKVAVYAYVNRSDKEYRLTFKGRYREHLTGAVFEDKFGIAPQSYGLLSRETD